MIQNVVIFVFPGVQILDAAGPHEVLALANRPAVRYALWVVSLRGGPVRSSNGLVLETVPIDQCPPRVDLWIVPGGSGVHTARRDAETLAALGARMSEARRIASVCTGAFLLGELGLLDGRRSTTHWASCDALQRAFPETRVAADPIFVVDGPVWTSAGVTAGIDLALALVREDHGPALALEIARWLVVFVQRPGGQAQFSVALEGQARDGGPLDGLLSWMPDQLQGDLGVAVLSRRACMSERNFQRVFRATLGVTPARYVQRLRLEAAQRLLQDPNVAIRTVSERCGFGTIEALERAFRKRLGVTPSSYRERFSAGGPDARTSSRV